MGMQRKSFAAPQLSTTLALLRQYGACASGYAKLMKSLTPAQRKARNQPIPLLRVLKSNGISDALWCLCAVPVEQSAYRDKLARLFACDCAERVLPIFEARHPHDAMPLPMSLPMPLPNANGGHSTSPRCCGRAYEARALLQRFPVKR